MFEKKPEPPVAEVDREGLVERKHRIAPGQKLILVATSVVAASLILFGIASRNNYFGIFGLPTAAKAVGVSEPKTLAPPEVKVPLNLGSTTPAPPPLPRYVECDGGLRLPMGLDCPKTTSSGGSHSESDKQPAKEGLTEEERVQARRRNSPIDIKDARGGIRSAAIGVGPGVSAATGAALTSLVGLGGSSLGADNALSGALVSAATPGTRATVNRKPSMTLAKGTLPDCTLLTAILTDQPGFLKCVLSAPVMSMDGKVVLMEAGTTMEGEYTQGVQRGQSSIFTVWSRAVTPHFVSVQLNSPGTDALGRAGTTGQVDNKWFERFAGAVFFSLFEDAKQILIAKDDARAAQRANANNTGNTFNFGSQGTLSQLSNTDSTTRSIVEEMLKQGSEVRPSLYKNQGEIIKIYVARDVDFSDVYELRPTAGN